MDECICLLYKLPNLPGCKPRVRPCGCSDPRTCVDRVAGSGPAIFVCRNLLLVLLCTAVCIPSRFGYRRGREGGEGHSLPLAEMGESLSFSIRLAACYFSNVSVENLRGAALADTGHCFVFLIRCCLYGISSRTPFTNSCRRKTVEILQMQNVSLLNELFLLTLFPWTPDTSFYLFFTCLVQSDGREYIISPNMR